jgi:two-component system CheB/CheR fusion protein
MPNPPFDLAAQLRHLLPEQILEYAVILVSPDGTIVDWLSGAERIFGYTTAEAVGQKTSILFTPEDLQKGIHEFELQSAREKGNADDDRWMRRKDGLRFWATGTLCSLVSAGQLIGFAKIVRNRTDLKGQIESLSQRVANLQRADDRKNAFIATLSHELRNPLASLVNAFEILKQLTPRTDDTGFATSTIQRQIDAMRRLIEDLMDVARIGAGKVELKKTRISLGEVIHAGVDTCCRSHEQTHELKLLLPEAPVYVDGDPDRLQQVFVNLLQNAFKYTEYGGKVFVEMHEEGKTAVVRVQDSGIGISPELLPRIFDLFIQAEFSTAQGGLGIGLSVVKDLVTLHGGSVQVQSDGIGKGSLFIVRLPLALPDALRPDAPLPT